MEIQCMWNVQTKVIPVIIGATGTQTSPICCSFESLYEPVIQLWGLAELVVSEVSASGAVPTFSYRLLSNRTVHCYSYQFTLYCYNYWEHHLVSEEYVQSVCCVAHRIFILFVLFLSLISSYIHLFSSWFRYTFVCRHGKWAVCELDIVYFGDLK